MKKIIFILALSFTVNLYADQYIVVFDKNTKKQVKSFILPDAEPLPEYDNTDLVVITVSKQDYKLLSDGVKWNENTENWLKTQANLEKLNKAISAKEANVKIEKKIKLKKEILAIEELLKTETGEEANKLMEKKSKLEEELGNL